jgi:antitoxin VapB
MLEDSEVAKLAAEVAALTHETATEAVRLALLERKARLLMEGQRRERGDRLERFLREEVWPYVPEEFLGRRISKKEEESILGYGPDGF